MITFWQRERLTNQHRVTQLENDGARIWMQTVWLQQNDCYHFCLMNEIIDIRSISDTLRESRSKAARLCELLFSGQMSLSPPVQSSLQWQSLPHPHLIPAPSLLLCVHWTYSLTRVPAPTPTKQTIKNYDEAISSRQGHGLSCCPP